MQPAPVVREILRMPASADLLATAASFHRQGNLGQAERIYRQVLNEEPNNVDALHLLGVVAHQSGKQDAAIALIQQALEQNPGEPTIHSNLASALVAVGRFDEAEASCRTALSLDAD